MYPILDTLIVEQALQQYREDYAQLSRESQAYREDKESEIQRLKDELEELVEYYRNVIGV